MSAQTPQPDTDILWLSEPELPGGAPRPALRGWLTDGGLLTARMRRLCQGDFRLEVLAATEQDATGATLRRVVLWCGANACIYAETAIPASTLNLHPWLNELGDEPLGETLQGRPEVSRDAFEYALLSREHLPLLDAAEIACGNESLWARRSAFVLGSEPLTVTEVFLPGVTDCEKQRIHVAD